MMANRSVSLWYWKAREEQFFTKNHVGWVERRNHGDCHRNDADGPPAHQELLIVAAVLERVVEADQEGDEDEQAEDDVVHRWEGGAQHLETSGTGEARLQPEQLDVSTTGTSGPFCNDPVLFNICQEVDYITWTLMLTDKLCLTKIVWEVCISNR